MTLESEIFFLREHSGKDKIATNVWGFLREKIIIGESRILVHEVSSCVPFILCFSLNNLNRKWLDNGFCLAYLNSE